MVSARVASFVACVALTACARRPSETTPPLETSPDPRSATAAMTRALAPGSARIGAEAPDFELSDLDGNPLKLSSFRGKIVVLEWFNPGCPFVKASHTKGSLVSAAARHAKDGVVWLAINSGAPGKQGHGADVNREARQTFGLDHPILLDESGSVGKAYGAAHTPHLYVVDARGVLAYRGAIDNSPDGEGDSPTGGKLINYVDDALVALRAGRPVAVAETEAYGCSVKYAK